MRRGCKKPLLTHLDLLLIGTRRRPKFHETALVRDPLDDDPITAGSTGDTTAVDRPQEATAPAARARPTDTAIVVLDANTMMTAARTIRRLAAPWVTTRWLLRDPEQEVAMTTFAMTTRRRLLTPTRMTGRTIVALREATLLASHLLMRLATVAMAETMAERDSIGKLIFLWKHAGERHRPAWHCLFGLGEMPLLTTTGADELCRDIFNTILVHH